MQSLVPKAPREARHLRRAASGKGVSDSSRFQAAESAGWPVGRVGTATSQGALAARQLTLTRGASEH
eukprot:13403487-Alexandrium_andersonii.AAC.1